MHPFIENPIELPPDEAVDSPTTEFLECCIGGYRFGIPTSQVLYTDSWCITYLDPIPKVVNGVLGHTLFDGRSIPVIDLRQLFCLDAELGHPDAQMFLVTEHQDDWFALLIDGLMSIQCMPLNTFKSFTSLYVSGVRWLSGACVLGDGVVTILDLEALKGLNQVRSKTG